MNVKISDLMVEQVMRASPHQSVGHISDVMSKHRISSMPVLNGDEEPLGIVTATDVVSCENKARPVSQIMTRKVYTVPAYGDPSLAARVMRNHKIHHVLVTHEKKVVGILSSYDLLRLVEDKRFVLKNAPDTPKRNGGSRKKTESDD